MTKSQFNIKISKDLLIKVKRQARMSGKSLTQHITDLVTNSLSQNENDILNNDFPSVDKIKDLEKRLLSLESIVRNREYLSQKFKPFTNLEAINCTKFMRAVFYKELEKRNYDDKYQAFDDFLLSLPSLCTLILCCNYPRGRWYLLGSTPKASYSTSD